MGSLKKITYLISMFILVSFVALAQEKPQPPSQPTEGPGGSNYLHEEVKTYDFAKKSNGFFLYEPAAPKPDSAHVIVFMHGFGAQNPLAYGAWIKHLVRKGNTVIFPMYQKKLLRPLPPKFVKNTVQGVHDALALLNEKDHVHPKSDELIWVGHSYGAAIATYLGVTFDKYNLPQPKAILACQPGTGKLKSGRMKDYSAMPSDIKLLVVVGKDDKIVGDKLARTIFKTAGAKEKNLILHVKDQRGKPEIEATHAEPCSIDMAFDSGQRNYITRAIFKRVHTDAVDYFCYWKLLDGLISCSLSNKDCKYVLGNTYFQRNMGLWSNGYPIRPLSVYEELKEGQ